MNCGGQTILWPLAAGLNGKSVHLLYSTSGGASTWIEPSYEGQDLQTCASLALGRVSDPGWNYVTAEQMNGCSPSPAYWITVNKVFGWKSAITISPPGNVIREQDDGRRPQAPAGFKPLPDETPDHDWREDMAQALREAENDDVEQALLVEARTQRSIRIATERNPQVAPSKIAEAIRQCRKLVPDATVGRDQCHNLPVLFTGADAAGARDHDIDALAGRPDWVLLHRWLADTKVSLGVQRQWYRAFDPCNVDYDGSVINCDEYPFFSSREGYDRDSTGAPVASWAKSIRRHSA